MTDLEKLIVPTHATMRDVITTIDASGSQFALVVDAQGRLCGVVTDGDIRRAILRGITLTDSVSDVMNREPKTATPDDSRDELLQLMNRLGIRFIPVLDDHSRVQEIVTSDGGSRSLTVTTPVVLMAGGRGQRLYPLTKDVPKPMLPVGDSPILEIILRRLASQGFRRVYISVNYLADVITDYVGDGSQFGLIVEYLREERPLGTAGALFQLKKRITEPFVVMNSDLLTHVNLRRLLRFHTKEGYAATVGVREYAFEVPFGVVDLDGGRVAQMVEKPIHRSLVNAGIYVLNPDALDRLADEEYQDMPSLLGELIDDHLPIGAFPIHEPWLDVGRPEDLDRARESLENWESS